VSGKKKRLSHKAPQLRRVGPEQGSVARLCEQARLAILRGNLKEAESAYTQAIALGAHDSDTLNNLGTVYDKLGIKEDESIDLVTKAYALAPNSPDIRRNLVSLLKKRVASLGREGRYRQALPLAMRRMELEPDVAQAQRDLGACYAKIGQLETAIRYYTRAINLEPNNPSHYNDLGLACYQLRLLAEAQGAFQEVLRLNPKSAVAYTHLGLLANLTGLTGVAVSFLRRALEVEPTCAEAQNNMALFLRDQGELQECRQHYNEALRLRPNNANMFSGYLLSLNDDPDADPRWVAAEHRRFQSAIKVQPRTLAPKDGASTRRLRIGYLSPDFRTHSVAFFAAPILEAHDPQVVEVTCYSTGNMEDAMTERIRKANVKWRRVFGMSDEELAETILADGIDVLVELSGHTSANRLAMLANRVAPVQMTYLGYANTTGLREMDYRITDAIADPVGASDSLHTETLLRIEGGFLAYQPSDGASTLPTVELPAAEAGYVTFGSFNNLAKINNLVLDTWATILQRVPNSRILIKAKGLRDDRVKERILGAFAVRGIVGEERVRLLGQERSAIDHLRLYNQMDLALDSFPYNGTTTTCEALWMGTPVVTFAGQAHAGRVGASLLIHGALPELVVRDRASYIELAVVLASDRERLRGLRRGLRERFAASAAMDSSRLARRLEAAYRQSWDLWQSGTGQASASSR
jgi:protein O-GlcNAc transferase